MFRPATMQLATLYTLRDQVPEIALALAESGAFAPEITEVSDEALPESPSERFREVYHSARTRLDKVLAHCDIDFTELPPAPPRSVTLNDLERTDAWLGQVWNQCFQQLETVRRHGEETRHWATLLASLDAFAKLDIDLSLLQHGGRFLDVRVGTVGVAETPRLAAALKLAGYVLVPYHREHDLEDCILAGPRGREQEIHPLLQSAGWRALTVPEEFSGHPQAVRARLTSELEAARRAEAQSSATMRAAHATLRPDLIAAAQLLHSASAQHDLAQWLRARGGLTRVRGWVPEAQLAHLRARLDARLGAHYLLELRPPTPEETVRVPSFQRHPRWLAPFAALVRNYGVPRYGEIDPTWLFAVSFVLMFGMMFGDIGHGALIALAGLALRRLRPIRPMLVAAGISSMAFGALYGSVFGFEEWIHPLWMAPLSDPTRMLMVALGWGIAFILLGTALTIVNRWHEGAVREALFAAKGVAGLLFYLAVIHVAWRVAGGAAFRVIHALMLCLPLGAIAWHLWRAHPSALAERVLVVLVETLETVLNYTTNTLSFLRVAAFSLNHVALALAVFTLARMMGEAGHWVTVILGNAFILILEGAIVAIQVLRLEYYEGFSRFFQGTGKAFRPLAFGGHPTQKN